ncbi:sulfurtransferase [Ornithinibacillus sp. BX22]|uniref:Sulfurtransferase n=1 Tax=Ornithinibacillus hominis TaxID=2763055 RepID=A0A923L5K9_9BACI|nr:sulfurtransferase [Ornithinibacillus hominis]MBC5636887.1 sulfurtransferase [Ornithinibacillus hominis]
MTYIMKVEELIHKLTANLEDIVLVDARFQLGDPTAGRKAYEESHVPGAVYFDLERDLSSEAGEHGGNHPLPDITTLADKLGKNGIDQDTTVVVYDKGNDMFAPRFWWLLHYLGHQDVYVLDGGFEAWVQAGQPVTADIPVKKQKIFIPNVRPDQVVDIAFVRGIKDNKQAVLIDSRSEDRYLGKTEPLYQKAGHIPGAKNYFWMDVLDENGNWKNRQSLEKQFAKLDKNKEIIVSCGSGVSATPNIMALKMAGFKHVKLYPGSYSDWISYEEHNIETKDETDE